METLSPEDLAAWEDAKSAKKTKKNEIGIAKTPNWVQTLSEQTGEKPKTFDVLGNKTTKFIFDLCLGSF
jgi:hypothetical protein